MMSCRMLPPFGGSMRRSISRLAVAAIVAAPMAASAQGSGDGFLFHRPYGSFGLRVGYIAPSTSGEPFTVLRQQTTVGSRSFDAPSVGLDLSFAAGQRFDVVFNVDGTRRATTARYPGWFDDQTNLPIQNTATLGRLGLGGSIRYNLVDRGRRISSFAFIPAHVVPYVGLGGGYMWYDLKQSGDFIEETGANTANVFSDELRSSGSGLMGQAFTGIEYRLNARLSLLGEARYTRASADLNNDYAGLGRIDLSGFALNIGTSIRF
jgi:hypothetical protein